MFKSITVLKAANDATALTMSTDHLSNAIPEPTAVDPGKTMWQQVGFSRPDCFGETTVFVGADETRVFNVQVRERILPGKVIREQVKLKAEEYAARQGYKCGRKQLAEIKDEVVANLLPNSHIKATDIRCMVFGKYLIIGSTSARSVETVVNMLRGLFPEVQMQWEYFDHNMNTSAFMVDLILSDSTESGRFNCERGAVLAGEDKSTVRYKNISLDAEDVRLRLAGGMTPKELDITWDGSMSFCMTDKMQLRRIKFLDIIKTEKVDGEGEVNAFDADVALTAGEFKRLFNGLQIEVPQLEEEL